MERRRRHSNERKKNIFKCLTNINFTSMVYLKFTERARERKHMQRRTELNWVEMALVTLYLSASLRPNILFDGSKCKLSCKTLRSIVKCNHKRNIYMYLNRWKEGKQHQHKHQQQPIVHDVCIADVFQFFMVYFSKWNSTFFLVCLQQNNNSNKNKLKFALFLENIQFHLKY